MRLLRKAVMMKKSSRSMLGVTLLEIMLVLAIAAMVVVMSIRYYQQASSNQRVNAAVDLITGYVAAGVSYLNAVGTYANIGNGSALNPYLPNNQASPSPWGGAITVGGGTQTTFAVTFPSVPGADCAKLANLLQAQSKNVTIGSCAAMGSNGAVTVTITG